ncbi:hypothetical protein [Caballeronia sp. LZ001]|uniref:hypothetical protein n=1 Tax=Caballeronia sp. LZ001 TaxID=3038553 RepID=UPI0028570A95|nr:hypothetical protein [Caballeronia sp. LZ001]MDR5803391.1 hypothetical protein [Caballeronia sp. LZ001]
MNDRATLEKRIAELLPQCRAGGLPVEATDLDLDALEKALRELENEGIVIALHEIKLRFILEHACLCRIKNVPDQFDIKSMLRHEKLLAQRNSAVVFSVDASTGHVVSHIVDWSAIERIVVAESISDDLLDWETLGDRQAWALGKWTLETLLSRKPQGDKMVLSSDFNAGTSAPEAEKP